jgi:hypothetical protein
MVGLNFFGIEPPRLYQAKHHASCVRLKAVLRKDEQPLGLQPKKPRTRKEATQVAHNGARSTPPPAFV